MWSLALLGGVPDGDVGVDRVVVARHGLSHVQLPGSAVVPAQSDIITSSFYPVSDLVVGEVLS